MSAPVQRWTTATGLTGTEAKAAALFARALPPRELSPATQAKHLAALTAPQQLPRRFRIPAPVAIAIFFGGSMALAATRPAVRAWVRVQLEEIGIVAPAPKKVVSARPPVKQEPESPAIAPVELEDEGVTLEEIDVRVDAGPEAVAVVPAPAVAAPMKPGVKTKPVAGTPAAPPAPAAPVAPVAAPSAAAVPAVGGKVEDTPSIPLPTPPSAEGALSKPDLPDMGFMSTPQKVEVYLQRGDLDEAEELLQTTAGTYSDKLNLLRGEVLHARGRCKEANVYFTAVINTSDVPDALLERALYGRAVCFASLGDGAASHADIDRHVGKFPNGRFKATDEKLHRR